ncbi:helix-turn-helix transcriptional regulator [Microbacterium sp.]|uniref:helix-turn-helix transcriptional regulator n=1 Tax=Microbacterium sp. TaxID=51671 RepID=UPI003735CC89
MTSASTALLTDLSGVARLAGVQRAVVSMWRTRSAGGDDPFPQPVASDTGRMRFDADEVADWLARTGRGNNASAGRDAAISAAPDELSYSDPRHVAELEALVALGALTDELSPEKLHALATEHDPDDQILQREVAAHISRGMPWLDFAARAIDAAYSPSEALAVIARRAASVATTSGSSAPLTSTAVALVTEMVQALQQGSERSVTLEVYDVDLSISVVLALGDDTTFAVPDGVSSRRLRRRLLASGVPVSVPDEAALTVLRVPAAGNGDVVAMLEAVDEASLAMRAADTAIVIGPARVLTDRVATSADRIRADILRSGRVRAIARLRPGLVTGAPREALAVWVLGPPVGNTPIGDRFTAVADLTDRDLTDATRGDLVADLVTSLQSAREVRSRAFMFARFVRTASLTAAGDSLVSHAPRSSSKTMRTADLPALLDTATDEVRGDVEPSSTVPADEPAPEPAPISQLISDRHARVISGVRLDPMSFGDAGLVVVTAADLEPGRHPGGTRIDQLTFATRHPSATLTRPGDVVFRTSPTAAAWVDDEGSNVVAYPARVLRVNPSDPGGLVPEVIAADITGAATGPGAWKRWTLRRVHPQTIEPLRVALAEIAIARERLEARVQRLERYAALLVDGATTGAAVISPKPAADAASTQ